MTLAVAQGRSGDPDRGLQTFAEGFETSATTGDRWWEAELWRTRGELLAVGDGADAAQEGERCFEKAIASAQLQKARSLELRALMSLYRLKARTADADEAIRRLESCYGWFGEGFDTKDLIEARALLDRA